MSPTQPRFLTLCCRILLSGALCLTTAPGLTPAYGSTGKGAMETPAATNTSKTDTQEANVQEYRPDQADAYFQEENWQAATTAYQALLKQETDSGVYWFRLAMSHFNQEQYQPAVSAFQKALESDDTDVPTPAALLNLARSQAASGDDKRALATLATIADTGLSLYRPIKTSSQFASMAANPEYQALLETLKPCNTEAHRAFDFWIGEWIVTIPAMPGRTANSSITLSNNGCSIHEHYRTPTGYTGNSINFFDSTANKWHQTWIDNQGTPLYLDGNPQDGKMVLANENSRITWTALPDGRVRQHWQQTSDGGETWNTSFDGYYHKPED